MKKHFAKLLKNPLFICLILLITVCLAVGTVWAKYKTEIEIGTFDLSIEHHDQYYAVYSEDDNSLEFFYGVVPKKGTTSKTNKTVTATYYNNLTTSTSTTPEWRKIASQVKSVKFVNEFAPVSIKDWFVGFTNATSFDLTNLSTANASDISNLLKDCYALNTLMLGEKFGNSEQTFATLGIDKIITGFTKKSENDVTDYLSTNINLGTAETYTPVTYCYAIDSGGNLCIFQRRYVPNVGETLDNHVVSAVYSWRSGSGTTGYTTCEGGRKPQNTTYNWSKNAENAYTKVTVVDKIKPIKLDYWFKDFRVAETFDLTNLDTSDATTMAYMFYDSNKPTVFDLRHFDTSNVTNMSYMFAKCWALETVYLSSFDTSNVTNMTSMFDMRSDYGYTSKLKTIFVSTTFVTNKVTSSNNMFRLCNLLEGGKGTTLATIQELGVSAADSHKATYARIDKEGQQGYFTELTP